MRRKWIAAGVALAVVTAVAGAAAYQRGSGWKEYRYVNSRLMADLRRPDALIRTASLARLPRDLLKVPIARDVLTEDLAFYYEQHEDRLGLKGALKRIAYEHELDWSDRILSAAFDEPAEVALWRDGRGALRHFAVVMQRNSLAKVLQQAGQVALRDRQLKRAGEIDTPRGSVTVYALEINPRRTLLLLWRGDRIVVLSDPGLLFDSGNLVVPEARAAVVSWLDQPNVLARAFALDSAKPDAGAAPPRHTLAIGASSLALGYGTFLSGFKGLRFDFGDAWSTAVWIDPKALPGNGLGDAALWRAAPANPSACVLLPVDWRAARSVVKEADKGPELANAKTLAALDGSGLACWYSESNLYSPVFIARLAKDLPDRNAALSALATWAMAGGAREETRASVQSDKPGTKRKSVLRKDDTLIWRGGDAAQPARGRPTLAARGNYVVFSPDGALVDLVLDTLARKNPSTADQMPATNATLALVTPRPLAAMTQHEALAALKGPGDANLLAAAETHLPARMKALAAYPPYRLELVSNAKAPAGWQPVEWRTPEPRK